MKRYRVPLVAVALAVAAAVIYRDVFSGRVLAGRDVFRLFIPHAHFLAECLSRGELPLWIPHERLGQPFAAIPYSMAFYAPNVLAVLTVGAIASVTALQLFHVAVAAAGTFVACRRLGASFGASAFGAGAFALSHQFTLLAWAPNVAGALAWTGFQLALVRTLSRAPSARTVALLALTLAASLSCGSPETTLWQGAVLLGCLLAWSRTRRRQAFTFFAAANGLGLALAAPMLLPALELSAHSTRVAGVWKPLEWSVSFPQALSIAWPMAHLPMGPYRGGADQRYVASLFIGAIVFALAAFAFRRRKARPLVIAAAVLLLLSLGKNFVLGPLLELPPLGFFRYPAKYALGATYCLFLCAALGLDRAAAMARRLGGVPRPARLVGQAVAVAFGALVLGLLVGMLLGSLVRPGAFAGWYWLVFALTAAGLAWRFGAGRRWPLVAVAAVELGCAHAFLGRPAFMPAAVLAQRSQLAASIPKPFDGRVSVSMLETEAFEGDFGAFLEASRDALVPLRFVEEGLRGLEGYGDPEPKGAYEREQAADRAAYDRLGVKYYVRPGVAPFEGLTEVAKAGPLATLYVSETAGPRAFVEAACESRVRLSEPRFTELAIDVEACAAGDLVVTDSWFPGWKADVDGVEVELEQALGGVRAVAVGPGRHHVRMVYRPRPFFWGCSLLALAVAFTVGLSFRRSRPS